MDPEERAREGVFMAFQYPVEIPGVNNAYFLKAALNAVRKHRGLAELDAMEFMQLVGERLKVLHIDPDLLKRPVNDGFSGGEKKRNEIFQMLVLQPTLAILDETDSGLDIDALKTVAEGVNAMRAPDRGIVVVTHYQRLLNYIVPGLRPRAVRGPDRQVGRQGPGAPPRRRGLRLDRRRGHRSGAGRPEVLANGDCRGTGQVGRPRIAVRQPLRGDARPPCVRAVMVDGRARRGAGTLHERRISDDAR